MKNLYPETLTESDVPVAEVTICCPCCQERLRLRMPLLPELEAEPEPIHRERLRHHGSGRVNLVAVKGGGVGAEGHRVAEAQGWTVSDGPLPRWMRPEGLNQLAWRLSLEKKLRWVLGGFAAIVSIAAIALMGHSAHQAEQGPPVTQATVSEIMTEEATAGLGQFLTATSPETRLKHVIDPERVEKTLTTYYANHDSNNADIRVSEFVANPAQIKPEDLDRGIMCFVRLGTEKSHFADLQATAFITSQDAVMSPGATETGGPESAFALAQGEGGSRSRLLPSWGKPTQWQLTSQRSGASASRLYFTRNGRLDWETFIQHKDLTLNTFCETPTLPPQIFRVMFLRGATQADGRSEVLICDLCLEQLTLGSVLVDPQTPVGRRLLTRLAGGQPQTATVELAWHGSPSDPALMVRRLICWELLGVGGLAEPGEAL
jgi:hypothetical protein